jgi:hypothetical protein
MRADQEGDYGINGLLAVNIRRRSGRSFGMMSMNS